jgi:hypothetical protein
MHFFLQIIIFLISSIYSFQGISSTIKVSQSLLAIELYLDGNYIEAIKKWNTLAEKGVESAQFKLGIIYRFGKGEIKKNINESIKWFTLAAENGNEYAQYNLGEIYESAENIINYKLAAKWYLIGAEKGNTFSQLKLGALYIDGRGVPQNLKYAHMWFNISEAQGNYRATKRRILLQKEMSFPELQAARLLAKKCFQNNYKNCK